MNISFKDQVALVTGAASGLGLATAQAFADAEASVVVAHWHEEAARTAAAGITAKGGKALAICCDVSKTTKSKRWLPGPSKPSVASTSLTTMQASKTRSPKPPTRRPPTMTV